MLTALENGNFFGCLSNAYDGRALQEPWIALVERGDCTYSEKLKQVTNRRVYKLDNVFKYLGVANYRQLLPMRQES